MRFSSWYSGAAMCLGAVLLIVPAFSGSSGQAVPPSPDQALPAGPGRDTFVTVCSACHLTSVATSQRKSADDWASTVIEMRGRGATGSDDDMDAIVNYLAKNFGISTAAGRVNINTAAAADIAGALSLTPSQAGDIVAFRDKNGKFKDVAGLEQVPGTDTAKIEAAKDRIDF